MSSQYKENKISLFNGMMTYILYTFNKENFNFSKRKILDNIIGISFIIFFVKKILQKSEILFDNDKLNLLKEFLSFFKGKNEIDENLNTYSNIFKLESQKNEFYHLINNPEILENLIEHF